MSSISYLSPLLDFNAYSSSGSIAEETLASIKTVAAFGGEERAMESFSAPLKNREGTILWPLVGGLGHALLFCSVIVAFAIGFWVAGELLASGIEERR